MTITPKSFFFFIFFGGGEEGKEGGDYVTNLNHKVKYIRKVPEFIQTALFFLWRDINISYVVIFSVRFRNGANGSVLSCYQKRFLAVTI